jgi:hypothetical protein
MDTRVREYDGEVVDTRIREYDDKATSKAAKLASDAHMSSSYQKLGTNYLVSILDCSGLDNGYPRSRV